MTNKINSITTHIETTKCMYIIYFCCRCKGKQWGKNVSKRFCTSVCLKQCTLLIHIILMYVENSLFIEEANAFSLIAKNIYMLQLMYQTSHLAKLLKFPVIWSNASDCQSFGQIPKICSHLAKWLKMTSSHLAKWLKGISWVFSNN